MAEPDRQLRLPEHRISKHAPQLRPLLNSAVLSAAVFVPYPALYKLP